MQNRSVPKVIILSLITLGIYTLFWLRDTRKELVERGQNVPPVKILFTPLLLLIFSVVLQFFSRLLIYRTPSLNDASAVSFNAVTSAINIFSILSGIAILLLIPISIWWFYKYCKAVEVITNNQTSLALSFGLLLLLGFFGFSFVWPGIIQDGFNRLSLIPTPSPSAPGTPQV